MFSFQGASESLQLRDSMKPLVSKKLQSISLVEISGIEPLTSCLQGRRSPSWAKPPDLFRYKILDIRYFENRCLIKDAVLAHPLSCILYLISYISRSWWAKMDSNHRPHDYQSCALASWAIGPYLVFSHFLGTFPSVPSKLNNEKLLSTLYWP